MGAAAATIRISRFEGHCFLFVAVGGCPCLRRPELAPWLFMSFMCIIMLTIVLTQGACLGAVHVGLDDGLEIGAVRAYFGDEMGIAGIGGAWGGGAVEVDVHLGGVGVTGQGPFTVK